MKPCIFVAEIMKIELVLIRIQLFEFSHFRQLLAARFAFRLYFVFVVCRCFIWRTKTGLRARVGRPQTSSSPPVVFIAGRPKAALLFWFFGDFRCGALLFMVIHVIYKYKNK